MGMAWLGFGEIRPEYPVPVMNERVVRGAAGLMFFFAMASFMNAWLLGNFGPTRVFVVAFLIDFSIRLFINPRLAPSMVLAQWLVRKQQPEYTGAAQKRFAWGLGFALALSMFYLIVLKGVVGPINMLICGLCLLLMFLESALGICVGCWIYNRFWPGQAQLCPGGVCDLETAAHAAPLGRQWVAGVAALAAVVALAPLVRGPDHPSMSATGVMHGESPSAVASGEGRCEVPAFAKVIGHEAMWKKHNGCE